MTAQLSCLVEAMTFDWEHSWTDMAVLHDSSGKTGQRVAYPIMDNTSATIRDTFGSEHHTLE